MTDPNDLPWDHGQDLDVLSDETRALLGPLDHVRPGIVTYRPRIAVAVHATVEGHGVSLRRLVLHTDGDRLRTSWLDPEAGSSGDAALRSAVSRLAGREQERVSAADIGLLVMYQLALSYTHARRELHRRVERFEDGLYADMEADVAPSPNASAELNVLRKAVGDLRDALDDLNQPGMKHDPELVWLGPDGSLELAERVDELIDRALRNLRSLADRIRQLTLTLLAREQNIAQERFQRLAGFVSFGIIAPGLVATVCGASIFSASDDQTTALVVMLIGMAIAGIGSAAAAYLWIRRGTAPKSYTAAREDSDS